MGSVWRFLNLKPAMDKPERVSKPGGLGVDASCVVCTKKRSKKKMALLMNTNENKPKKKEVRTERKLRIHHH